MKNDLTLEIDSLSYGPYGIGRHDGKTIMIPGTAPGDAVEARIVEAKPRYATAEIVRLIRASPVRQSPPCPYVGRCGGCPWQHVRYDAQLSAKQQSVEDALRRIGKLDGFTLRPIVASPLQYHYRRRVRLQRTGTKRLGFFRAFSHELIEIDSCLIADPRLNRLIDALQAWSEVLDTDFGHLQIVTGDDTDRPVVVGHATGPFRTRDESSCENLLTAGNPIAGLLLRGPSWRRAWGDTAISVVPENGLRLSIDAEVFTQINSEGNRQLVAYLITAAEIGATDRILELYSGAGNFTLAIAKRAGEVVAVEGQGAAVDSGRQSADANRIGNIRWIRAPVPAALARLRKNRERFSKIVLDPPRAGAKGTESDVASLGAERILYLSCNPATLARDLGALAKHGYRLETVQPFDLFPHTFHVETLATLVR